MSRVSRRVVFLSLILPLLGGCSKEASNPAAPGSAPQIWPLAVGNRWTMDYYRYNSRIDELQYLGIQAYRIGRDTLLDGIRWYEGSGSDVGFELMANFADGFWIRLDPEGLFPVFPYPAMPGSTRRIITGDARFGFDTTLCTVLSISESVTVPAGTFSCISYQFRDPGGNALLVYRLALGVGPVAEEYTLKRPWDGRMVLVEKWELVDYFLN